MQKGNIKYTSILIYTHNAQALVLSNDVSIPIGLQEDNIRFVPERYEVLEEVQKLYSGKTYCYYKIIL